MDAFRQVQHCHSRRRSTVVESLEEECEAESQKQMKKMKKTTDVNDEIAAMVKQIIAGKIKHRQHCLDRGDIPPACDLRDFTSNDLIYGIKTIPLFGDISKIDADHYNLGRCLAYDYVIPTYKFFRFKDMYEVLCNLYDECGGDVWELTKHDCATRTLRGIFDSLSNNSKYRSKWHGNKCGYHFCIFIYAGAEYANNLTKLAEKFRERDVKEAQASSEYYNSRLAQACERIMESIEHRKH